MTQPDLFGPAATAARQPTKCDLPLLLAASADHVQGGALPASPQIRGLPLSFECWYFYGTGDVAFGGNADDQVLYTDGTRFRFFSADWTATREGFSRALFASESAAMAAGEPVARAGARVSAIVAR